MLICFKNSPKKKYLVRELDYVTLRLVDSNPFEIEDYEHYYSKIYAGIYYPVDNVFGYYHETDLNKWTTLRCGIGSDDSWIDSLEHAEAYRSSWDRVKADIEQYIEKNPVPSLNFFYGDVLDFHKFLSNISRPMKLINYMDKALIGVNIDINSKLLTEAFILQKKKEELVFVSVNDGHLLK